VGLDITVDREYQQRVMDDLNRRRFTLQSVDEKYGNSVSVIQIVRPASVQRNDYNPFSLFSKCRSYLVVLRSVS